MSTQVVIEPSAGSQKELVAKVQSWAKEGRNLAVTGYIKCHGKVIRGSISKTAEQRPGHTKLSKFF